MYVYFRIDWEANVWQVSVCAYTFGRAIVYEFLAFSEVRSEIKDSRRYRILLEELGNKISRGFRNDYPGFFECFRMNCRKTFSAVSPRVCAENNEESLILE